MMLVEQCRAGRALLAWSAQRLADEAQIGVATVRRYEGGSVVVAGSIDAMRAAMQQAGVVFVDADETSSSGGPGVRIAATPSASER